MSFELTILGSSAALPTSKRFPTAHLLKAGERFFLIDCGEGTQIRLRQYGINPSRIHHILISHLHGDHVFGLFGLLSSLGMMGRKVPLHLYGPHSLEEFMNSYSRFFGPLPFDLEFKSHAENSDFIFESDKLTIKAIPLKHRIPAFGYLFREKKKPLNIRKEQIEAFGLGMADIVKVKRGEDFVTDSGTVIPNSQLTLPPFHQRSYAYLSDTLFDPQLAEIVKGVDLLFHEATFSDRDKKLAAQTQHSTAAEAATLAKMAGVKKLLIGHFSSRYKEPLLLENEAKEVFENTTGVNDGDIYSIPPERLSGE
ncbi:MAG: ribonuclease Z [Bacteroidales bacterium]|nr:ribonuclease Z [Bacteroidales bacterium]